MDQTALSGIGNYIKAEALYRYGRVSVAIGDRSDTRGIRVDV